MSGSAVEDKLSGKNKPGAEESRQHTEKEFKYILEHLPIAAALSRNGLTVNVNSRYLDMFGYQSVDEVFGHPITEQIAPGSREDVLKWLRERGSSEKLLEVNEFEAAGLRKDGTEFPFYVAVTRVDLAEGPTEMGVFIDIPERKRIENELRTSEERTRYILKYIPGEIAVFDNQMRYILVSDRFLSDLKVGDRNIIGLNHYDVFPDLPQWWKEVHKRVLAGAVERCEDDQYVRPDGLVDYIRWEARPWYDANGKIGGIILYTEITTARRRAEEAMRKREEEFRALVEQSPDVIVRSDRQLRYLYVNPRASQLTGIPTKDFLGKTTVEIGFPAKLVAAWNRTISEVFATGQDRTLEFEFPLPGGTISYHARAVPVPGKGGAIESVITICHDITELKRVQRELTQARETAEKRANEAEEGRRTLDAMMDNLPEGIMIVDAEGRIRMVSKYMSRIIGSSPDADRAKSLDEFEERLYQPPTVFEAPNEYPLFRVLHGGGTIYSEEWGVTRMEGEEMSVVITATPIRDDKGKVIGAMTAWRDITDRKKMEDRLRRNEYELRTLVDNSPDLIVRFDKRMRYVYANPAYERIAGIPQDRLAGKTNRELGMPEDTMRYWESAARKVFESGREESVEFELASFFGKRYFWGKIIPEFAKDGSVETVMTISRDITERKMADERIRYISFHDEVTGLFNRAFFEEELRRLDMERELPISLIMGDVNNLKLTNDAFGHDEGDKLLRDIASILRNSCRQNDVIARWGGDEFTVILPKTARSTAEMVIRRIRQSCGEVKDSILQPSIALGVAAKENKSTNIYKTLREAESGMYQYKAMESQKNQRMVIAALLDQVDKRGNEAVGHRERMKELSLRVGSALGLSEKQKQDLYLISDIHDIGKITIATEVLKAPRRLTAQEGAAVARHAEAGYRIARSLDVISHVSDILLAHHEHWDGTGYPRRLKGDAIPLLARVFSIVEAYDVMTHARPYARTFSEQEAVEELKRNAGKQFDPECVNSFVGTLQRMHEERAAAKQR